MAQPKTELTRDRVLEVATQLIERSGVGQLSMRALARDLDVGVMTLYGYIRTKDELLDSVTDAILRQLDLTVDPASPWDQQLATIFTRLLDSLDRQPGARELLLLRSAEGPASDQVRETVIRILRSAGYTPAQSLHALAILYSFTLGYAATSHRSRAASHEFGQVNVRTSPYLAEALLAYPERTTRETYTTGLQFLIDGIAANLDRNDPGTVVGPMDGSSPTVAEDVPNRAM
jgi:AcrR family transcriptional regulator